MIESIQALLEKLPEETVELFKQLRELIYRSSMSPITEKMWAKLPSYYLDDAFVRLIPFKDHINVEAKAVLLHQQDLVGFRITPKGMLQIFTGQKLPEELLKQLFAETLTPNRISE